MSEKNPTSEKKYRDGPSPYSLLGTASTMGLHMVSGPIVGGSLGYLVDRFAGTWPWGSGIGVLLGIAAGFRNVWRDANYLRRQQAEIDKEAKREEAMAEHDDEPR